MKLLVAALLSALQLTALANSTVTCSTCPSSTPAGPDVVTRKDAPTTPCSAAVLTAIPDSSTGGASGGANGTGGIGGGGGASGTGGGSMPTPMPNAGGRVAVSAGIAVVAGVVAVCAL